MGMGLQLCGCEKKTTEEDEESKYHSKTEVENTEETPKTKIESPRITSSNNVKSLEDLMLIDRAILIGKGQGNIKDKYEMGKKLGSGSYGQVYLCINKRTKEKVAVKVIKKGKKNNNLNQNIIQEIDILKILEHSNIINLFEFYEGKFNYYLVTEYCMNGNLFDFIRKSPNLISESRASVILFQILSAINYCHSKKIIHRDIKPENIMLDMKLTSGYPLVKIIDFGTSKIIENEYENEFIGTPYFIAPEVIKKQYNNKCDLWSIGVLLYFIITKKRPFTGKNFEEVFNNIQNNEIDFNINGLNNSSEELKDLITNLLKKNPDERLSAEEALNHNWFIKNKTKEKLINLPTTEMTSLLDNIRLYNPKNKLQQLTLAYLVINYPNANSVQKASCLFIKLDKDNSGIIDTKEFVHGLKELYDEEGKNVDEEFIINNFKRIDSNNSGNIEYEEFIRAAVDKKEFLNENIMKEAFIHFDLDKNGNISVDDISKVLGFKDHYSEFAAVIEECDIDQNGAVEYDEFIYIMEKILL